MFHLLFGASRPLQHNKAPKPGDRGRDTARVSDRTVSPPPPFLLFLPFSPATSSSNLFLSPSTFLHHLVLLAIYIPLLFIIPFFFCFSMHGAGPPSFFLPPCFCLLREESASYGFYSLVMPPPRIPLSSPPNRPLFPFLHLGFFSTPYASLFHYPPCLSQIARLTHQEKPNFFNTHGRYRNVTRSCFYEIDTCRKYVHSLKKLEWWMNLWNILL